MIKYVAMYASDIASRLTGIPLLVGLPASEMALISPHLSRRTFVRGTVIIGPGIPDECHFVRSGLVAIVFGPNGADPIGVSLLGFDDFLGIAAMLGTKRIAHSAVALTNCSTLSLSASDLREACQASADLRERLLEYTYARTADAMRSAACNLRHSLERRLATWILTASDLLQESRIQITHRALSALLGVRRPTMTVALQNLEGSRAIWSRRNLIVVRDAMALRQFACECHSDYHNPLCLH